MALSISFHSNLFADIDYIDIAFEKVTHTLLLLILLILV